MTGISSPQNGRLHLVDYIRCMVYLAIASFHFTIMVRPTGEFIFSDVSVIWFGVQEYARHFVNGGQIILLLTFVLMGFNGSPEKKLKKILIGSFIAAFVMAVANFSESTLFWIWDIYPLIFLGALTLLVALWLSPRAVFLLAVLGAAGLSIPVWDLLNQWQGPLELRVMLVGDCRLNYADWPVLPWIGLIWLSFMIGDFFKKYRLKLRRLTQLDLLIGAGLLVFWMVFLNGYRTLNDVTEWSCFSFRRPPVYFWSQLLFYILLIRLALADPVQNFLTRFRFSHQIGQLFFSRSFGVYYIFHYMLTWCVAVGLLPHIRLGPVGLFLVFAALLVISEVFLSSVEKIIRSKNKV